MTDLFNLVELAARIRNGCNNAPPETLLIMLTRRRDALARQEEMEMPAAIIDRQKVMVEVTEQVARERGIA